MTDNPIVKAGKGVDDTRVSAYAVDDDAKADANSRFTSTQGILQDARGFTYRAVRFCDLDRICDK